MFAISGGYFAYDFVVSLRHVGSHGWPFVLHASACCFIFFKVSFERTGKGGGGELMIGGVGIHSVLDGRGKYLLGRTYTLAILD